MSSKKKILVFTATYNEVENIYTLITKIKKFNPQVHILIIDDNSPDGTADVVKTLKKKIRNLNLIIRKKKDGLDSAHKLAYDYAIKKNYDYLITMDGDLSHDPKRIDNFIKNLPNFEFVIGSRYMKGGKCLMKGKRLLLSKYGNLIIKKILNINLTEFTTSFRGFNLKRLNQFNLNKVKTNGYSFFMGTVFEIYNRGYSVKEIPIVFKDRVNGVSKIPKMEIFRTFKNLFVLYFKKKF
jgi:dolichol-phosphate mannosyltransferase